MASSAFFLVFATLIATGYGLHCYVCNSNQHEACKDPFDEHAANSSHLFKNCDVPTEADPVDSNDNRKSKTTYISPETGDNTNIKYSFCRKTIQKASLAGRKDEDRRIVRSCGFLNDTKLAPVSEDTKGNLKCYRKVGTFEVEMLYCACYESACNPAGRPAPVSIATLGSIILGMVIATRVL